MRLTVPSLVLAPVVLAALAFTSKPVAAEMLHVPFAFNVDGKNLPAGDYTVQSDLRYHLVSMTAPDGAQSFQWHLGPGDPAPTAKGVVMVFNHTDSGFSLKTIQYNSMITPRLNKKTRNTEDQPVHVIR